MLFQARQEPFFYSLNHKSHLQSNVSLNPKNHGNSDDRRAGTDRFSEALKNIQSAATKNADIHTWLNKIGLSPHWLWADVIDDVVKPVRTWYLWGGRVRHDAQKEFRAEKSCIKTIGSPFHGN